MSDIELVIKIPEEIMKYIKNNGCLSVVYNDEVAKAIINGTPLPKGHGRLIDADRLINEYVYDLDNIFVVDLKDIRDTPTIIDAESEVENADSN